MVRKEVEKLRKLEELNSQLVDNFVSLQKVMTNLAVKFDHLSDNLTKLLNLFEISARSFAENQGIPDAEKDKEFLDKINTLLDQNKTIAKGLTLMEEKLRERVQGTAPQPQERQFFQSPQGMIQSPNPEQQQAGFKKLPKF